MSDTQNSPQPDKTIGRNEPCPCGSGKKYKRCCGVAAAPKITPPKGMGAGAEGAPTGGMANGMGIPGMDNMSPEMMQQMQQMGQMLQRLPKGQMQKLQSIVQKAMSGKDVSREAEEFQKTLPVEFQHMLGMMAPAMAAAQGAGGQQANTGGESEASSAGQRVPMTEEEARKIVEAAAAEGKISSDEATTLLKKENRGIGKLWRGLTGK